MMGMPYREVLVEILKENFTDEETEIALMPPTKNTPLKPIAIEELADTSDFDQLYLSEILRGWQAEDSFTRAKPKAVTRKGDRYLML